jgi:hypothetical protein
LILDGLIQHESLMVCWDGGVYTTTPARGYPAPASMTSRGLAA